MSIVLKHPLYTCQRVVSIILFHKTNRSTIEKKREKAVALRSDLDKGLEQWRQKILDAQTNNLAKAEEQVSNKHKEKRDRSREERRSRERKVKERRMESKEREEKDLRARKRAIEAKDLKVNKSLVEYSANKMHKG